MRVLLRMHLNLLLGHAIKPTERLKSRHARVVTGQAGRGWRRHLK